MTAPPPAEPRDDATDTCRSRARTVASATPLHGRRRCSGGGQASTEHERKSDGSTSEHPDEGRGSQAAQAGSEAGPSQGRREARASQGCEACGEEGCSQDVAARPQVREACRQQDGPQAGQADSSQAGPQGGGKEGGEEVRPSGREEACKCQSARPQGSAAECAQAGGAQDGHEEGGAAQAGQPQGSDGKEEGRSVMRFSRRDVHERHGPGRGVRAVWNPPRGARSIAVR